MSMSILPKKTFAQNIMNYIDCQEPGDVNVLQFNSGAIPTRKENELLMKVVSTGINRADILQR